LKDNNFIYGALSDINLCRMFSFPRATVYSTPYEQSFSKNYDRGSLNRPFPEENSRLQGGVLKQCTPI